jgi:sensor histidine kinase YesM
MQHDNASRPKGLLTAAIILVTLAALEWWVTERHAAAFSLTGLLAGVGLMGWLVLGAVLLNRPAGAWVTSGAAALTAVSELVLGTFTLGLVSALGVLLLPFSVTAHFMQDDAATDLVVFSFLGLALWVAARSWWRYARQQSQVAQVQVAAAQAQAALAQRDRELAQSELLVLRAQIEPHFLWNTLAHVQHLIRRNPVDADRMTGYLIRYLRTAVPQTRGDSSTVGVELASVWAYLELMKIRMGERLTVEVISPVDLAENSLAPLLVQTLVENAIKHGIEPKVGPVRVRVQAGRNAQDATLLVIEVQDNGVGLHAVPAIPGNGLGLRSVRERLKLLYGPRATLTVMGAPSGGAISRITIPAASGATHLPSSAQTAASSAGLVSSSEQPR